MSAELPVPDPNLPPKGVFPVDMEWEIVGLMRQDREDLIPAAFERLSALNAHYDIGDAAAEDERANSSYEAFTKRYLYAAAPGIGGAVVGTLVESQRIMNTSLLWTLAVALVAAPRIATESMRSKPDATRRAASDYLKQAVARHPGRPAETENQ